MIDDVVGPIAEDHYGILFYEEPTGGMELWSKYPAGFRGLKDVAHYTSRKERKAIIKMWTTKHCINAAPHLYYILMKPTLPIDEETETEPITQSQNEMP